MLVDLEPPEGYYILFYIGQCTSNGTCVCHCGNCTSGCDACLPGWSGSTINNCQKCSIILKMTQYINYILVYYTVCITCNNHGQNLYFFLHGHDDIDYRKNHSSFLSANTFYGKASNNTTLVDGDFDTYVEDNNIPPYVRLEFQTSLELRQVDVTLELGR